MSISDPIANFLTRIRNALHARHEAVECPSSRTNREIARILKEEGFIGDYMFLDDRKQGLIRVDLKYVDNKPAIQCLQRVSRPGRRRYSGVGELPRVLGGLGVAIVTTSQGIMTDRSAREKGVGGEILCRVY